MIRNLLFPVLVVLCLLTSLYDNKTKKAKEVTTSIPSEQTNITTR